MGKEQIWPRATTCRGKGKRLASNVILASCCCCPSHTFSRSTGTKKGVWKKKQRLALWLVRIFFACHSISLFPALLGGCFCHLTKWRSTAGFYFVALSSLWNIRNGSRTSNPFHHPYLSPIFQASAHWKSSKQEARRPRDFQNSAVHIGTVMLEPTPTPVPCIFHFPFSVFCAASQRSCILLGPIYLHFSHFSLTKKNWILTSSFAQFSISLALFSLSLQLTIYLWLFVQGAEGSGVGSRGSRNKGCCVSNVVFISHDGRRRLPDRFPWRKGLKQMWTRPPAKSAFSLPFEFPSFHLSCFCAVAVSVFLSLVVRDCRVRDGRSIITILPGAKCF